MIRVAFIIESEQSAAARYRVLLNVDAFEREGVDVYPMSFPHRLGSRRKMFKDLASFDAAVLQRRLIQPWEFYMLRKRVRVLGYDFDDAVLYGQSSFLRIPSLSRRVKFRTIVRGVDFVTAGNAYLASLCGDKKNVFIVPTPVDTDAYIPAASNPQGPARIGWIGSRSTLAYLNDVLPAIEKVAAVRAGVTLTVVADVPPPARPFIRFVQWRENTEAAEVAAFDVGIMPLPDNRWTRGKCGFKLLLYGACGIPSVASPVGANNDVVIEGQTGLFASTLQQWQSALLRLIDDADLRRRLGAAARARIDTEYSTRTIVPKWSEILKSMASRRKD